MEILVLVHPWQQNHLAELLCAGAHKAPQEPPFNEMGYWERFYNETLLKKPHFHSLSTSPA